MKLSSKSRASPATGVLGTSAENALLVDDSSEDDDSGPSPIAVKRARRTQAPLKQRPTERPNGSPSLDLMTAGPVTRPPARTTAAPSAPTEIKLEEQAWEAGDEYMGDMVLGVEEGNEMSLIEMGVTGDDDGDFRDDDKVVEELSDGTNPSVCPVCSMLFDDDDNVCPTYKLSTHIVVQ